MMLTSFLVLTDPLSSRPNPVKNTETGQGLVVKLHFCDMYLVTRLYIKDEHASFPHDIDMLLSVLRLSGIIGWLTSKHADVLHMYGDIQVCCDV